MCFCFEQIWRFWDQNIHRSFVGCVCGAQLPATSVVISRQRRLRPTPWGDTPLHLAAFYGRVAAAELLLSKGAAVDAKDDVGPGPQREGQKSHLQLRAPQKVFRVWDSEKRFAFSANGWERCVTLHADIQEVPFREWQETQVQSQAELLSVDCYLPWASPHWRLILGERCALSRGRTPLDRARDGGETKMEQFLLNRPAWAPRAMFSRFSSQYELVINETRWKQDNWKIWAKELRLFENTQYRLQASWTARYFLNASYKFLSSIALEVQKYWISQWSAQSLKKPVPSHPFSEST